MTTLLPALRRHWTWIVLALPLAALLAGTPTLDRSGWPYPLVGDEATYLMQAESLAWDFDLVYSRRDYDRFTEHRGWAPEGLILQSGDDGTLITYGKPFFYAVYLAPFIRLAPGRGAYLGNVVLLALASVLAARALGRRLGPLAPLWIAALVFATVAFAYVFWAHADLFLFCLTAIAFATVIERQEEGDRDADWRRLLLRWGGAGLLLGVVGFSRPMYLTLFVPVLVAAPRRFRLAGAAALAAGGTVLVLGTVLVHQTLAGTWTSYGGSRRGFYSYTGYPEVDFPAADWTSNIESWGDHAWADPSQVFAERKMVASLWGWNAVYFFFGRHVGLVPYFLPLFLLLLARPRGAVGWSLLAAVGLSAAAFLYLRPFNFYGGGGAVANRYFLPLFPALWFAVGRRLKGSWIAGAVVAAGLFVFPLWLHPRSYPLLVERSYSYVSPVARVGLPYETSQSHLKPAGSEDVRHNGLWIKFLDQELRAGPKDRLLRIFPGRTVSMLVGFERPVEAFDLSWRGPPEARLEVRGGLQEILNAQPPRHRLRIWFDRPRACHPMWWTWEPVYLYRFTLRLEGTGDRSLPFQLAAYEP